MSYVSYISFQTMWSVECEVSSSTCVHRLQSNSSFQTKVGKSHIISVASFK